MFIVLLGRYLFFKKLNLILISKAKCTQLYYTCRVHLFTHLFPHPLGDRIVLTQPDLTETTIPGVPNRETVDYQ